jgi:hypothetical protein
MCGWYRKFVRDYAKIARPLTELPKQENCKKVATEMQIKECLEVFENLRQALMGPDVMLYHPDFNKRFRVDLDASCEAIGGVLLQQDDEGVWRPMAATHLEAMASARMCESMEALPDRQGIRSSHGPPCTEVTANQED